MHHTTQRDNHFPWACKQVKGLDTICHWLYATISPFQRFSNNSHIDDEDADTSILVNLGQHALLELCHYNVQLVLQPLDVVVFLSNSVYHCTLQHAAHVIDPKSQVGDCMAITCFFHQALVDHYEPTKTSIHYLAKEAAAREQDQKQQKKTDLTQDHAGK